MMSASPDARFAAVVSLGTMLGECPVWRSDEAVLTVTDAAAMCLHDVAPATGRLRTRPLPSPAAALAPMPAGDTLLACSDGLWRLAASGERAAMRTPDMSGIRFNDGKCDTAGRFWLGSRSTAGRDDGGILFRIGAGREPEIADTGFGVCNGMGWSPDARSFYLIDTVPRLLYRYACDPVSGALSGREILCRFGDVAGKPDGMAVDAAGRLWIAMWDGGGIVVLSPQGERLAFLATPAPRPTSCAFGGADLRTLFVTTATIGLDPADPGFARSGDLLVYRVDTPGLATGMFGRISD